MPRKLRRRVRKFPARGLDPSVPAGPPRARGLPRRRRSQAEPSISPESQSDTTATQTVFGSMQVPAAEWREKAKTTLQNAAPEFVQGLPKKEKTLGPPRNALDRSTKGAPTNPKLPVLAYLPTGFTNFAAELRCLATSV